MDEVTWRRADLGDLPEVGDEIVAFIYRRDDHSVTVYPRMRVDIVLAPNVYGAALPALTAIEFEYSTRPEQDSFIGPKAMLWRPWE
jgi:hypothetical protein